MENREAVIRLAGGRGHECTGLQACGMGESKTSTKREQICFQGGIDGESRVVG